MPLTHQDHLVNFELLKIARHSMGGFGSTIKRAFIPGGDPSQGGGGGGGGAPPPGGGGPPPMDPSMMGGAPPPGGGGGGGGDPSGGGGGGLDAILQKLNQIAMQMQSGGGAGGAGGAGGLKPKIDQNMVSVQILKTLARMCDHFGIHVPMSDMVPGMGDLNQLAAATQGQAPMPGAGGGDPSQGGAGAGAGAIGGVDPMQGMQPAGTPGMDPTKQGNYRGNGVAFDTSGLVESGNRAAAIMAFRRQRESK